MSIADGLARAGDTPQALYAKLAGSGRLTRQELERVIAGLQPDISAAEREVVFSQFEKDDSGEMDLPGFCQSLQDVKRGTFVAKPSASPVSAPQAAPEKAKPELAAPVPAAAAPVPAAAAPAAWTPAAPAPPAPPAPPAAAAGINSEDLERRLERHMTELINDSQRQLLARIESVTASASTPAGSPGLGAAEVAAIASQQQAAMQENMQQQMQQQMNIFLQLKDEMKANAQHVQEAAKAASQLAAQRERAALSTPRSQSLGMSTISQQQFQRQQQLEQQQKILARGTGSTSPSSARATGGPVTQDPVVADPVRSTLTHVSEGASDNDRRADEVRRMRSSKSSKESKESSTTPVKWDGMEVVGNFSPAFNKVLEEGLKKLSTEEEKLRFMISMTGERTRPMAKATEPSAQPMVRNLEWGRTLRPEDASIGLQPVDEPDSEGDRSPSRASSHATLDAAPPEKAPPSPSKRGFFSFGRAKQPPAEGEGEKAKEQDKATEVSEKVAKAKAKAKAKAEEKERVETLGKRAFVGGLAGFLTRCRPSGLQQPPPILTQPHPTGMRHSSAPGRTSSASDGGAGASSSQRGPAPASNSPRDQPPVATRTASPVPELMQAPEKISSNATLFSPGRVVSGPAAPSAASASTSAMQERHNQSAVSSHDDVNMLDATSRGPVVEAHGNAAASPEVTDSQPAASPSAQRQMNLEQHLAELEDSGAGVSMDIGAHPVQVGGSGGNADAVTGSALGASSMAMSSVHGTSALDTSAQGGAAAVAAPLGGGWAQHATPSSAPTPTTLLPPPPAPPPAGEPPATSVQRFSSGISGLSDDSSDASGTRGAATKSRQKAAPSQGGFVEGMSRQSDSNIITAVQGFGDGSSMQSDSNVITAVQGFGDAREQVSMQSLQSVESSPAGPVPAAPPKFNRPPAVQTSFTDARPGGMDMSLASMDSASPPGAGAGAVGGWGAPRTMLPSSQMAAPKLPPAQPPSGEAAATPMNEGVKPFSPASISSMDSGGQQARQEPRQMPVKELRRDDSFDVSMLEVEEAL